MAGPPPGGGCARSGAAMSPEPTAPERALPFPRPARPVRPRARRDAGASRWSWPTQERPASARSPAQGYAETEGIPRVTLGASLLAAAAGAARRRDERLMAAPTRSEAVTWGEGR